MASSLSQQKAASAAVLTKTQMAVAERMADGATIPDLARKLAKGDRKKAQAWRLKLRRWCGNPHFQKAVFDLHRGSIVAGLGPAIEGMNARAARGRIDAVKLAMAASGFHNDKVSHEHSGGIEITVNIPRPKPTEDHLGAKQVEQPYVDADVVED